MKHAKIFAVLSLGFLSTFNAFAGELVGNWVMKDGCVDQGDGTGLSLSASFSEDMTFSITVSMFEDASCTGPSGDSVLEGTYLAGSPSATVPGAVDLDLSIADQGTQYTIYKYDAGIMQIGTSAVGTDDGTSPENRHQGLLGEPFLFVKH